MIFTIIVNLISSRLLISWIGLRIFVDCMLVYIMSIHLDCAPDMSVLHMYGFCIVLYDKFVCSFPAVLLIETSISEKK